MSCHCKDCKRAAGAAWRDANPDKQRERCKRWRKNNPERVNELARAANARNPGKSTRWAEKNRDRDKAAKLEWRTANKEKVRAWAKQWAESNPERMKELKRISNRNRRARKKNSSGKLSKDIATKLFDLQRGKCACCGKPLGDDYHLDHIIPIALGGPNVDTNIQLLRSECNIRKSARHPIDYMQSKGFLL